MSYTSIIINNGDAEPASPIGVSIPSLLDNIEKDEKYVLQFVVRNLNNSETTLNHIYVGEQKLNDIIITDYETTIIDDISFYNCFIPFVAQENMMKPRVRIGRLKTASESSNKNILEITRLKLCRGETLSEYVPNNNDLGILKQEIYTMIQQLADSIVLKAKKEDLDGLNNKISQALGQIQVEAGKIELKVDNDGIISSINMSKEGIKINTSLLDLTGDLDLQGTFTCYKNNSNKQSNYLKASGAMMFGYNDIGGQHPVFASGLWTDQNMGYFSVGYTRADVSDANGCLWISPQHDNAGCRLTYSKLIGTDVYSTNLYFQKDGAIDFITNLRGQNGTDDNYTYRFDSGVSTKALRCNNLRTHSIYPRNTGSHNIGSPSMRYLDIFADSLSTTNSSLRLGTVKPDGSWDQYGPLSVNSDAGYVFPERGNGNYSLGMDSLRFSTLYAVNNPNISSDAREKTDIHYLGEDYENEIIENRSLVNMNITTEDMYDFVRNDLKLASYRYNVNLDRDNTSVDYGFIAQDILYTKVGSEIVQLSDKEDLDSNLSYNQGNYISTIVGALQHEINLRDKQIAELLERIEALENRD